MFFVVRNFPFLIIPIFKDLSCQLIMFYREKNMWAGVVWTNTEISDAIGDLLKLDEDNIYLCKNCMKKGFEKKRKATKGKVLRYVKFHTAKHGAGFSMQHGLTPMGQTDILLYIFKIDNLHKWSKPTQCIRAVKQSSNFSLR